MRLLSLLLLLLLLTGCQRYTIGAENAAPRVVSANIETAVVEQAEAGDHSVAISEETHTEGEAHTTSEAHSGSETHSALLPEIESALGVVQESFAHVRGSRTARHEAAESLETARQSVYALYEAGTISHGSELDEYFEVAIEKVLEGTNDAPNALTRLTEKLEKAGKH